MSSKWTAPLTNGACQRLRLFERLDSARSRLVVWLGASAGSGKSTLIASYLRSREIPHVWYNVDARDTDVASLFFYLKQACEKCGGAAPELALLSVDHPAHTRAFARRFFEALFAKLPVGAALVIDDCPPPGPEWARWYQMIREAAEAVPNGRRLILIGRSGLPATLSRLLAASALQRLDWTELKFSPSEAEQLVTERSSRLGIALSPAEVAEVLKSTDGWAAGIVLALECVRRHGRYPGRVFADHFEEAFDYFAAEVWDQTQPALRQVLLQTAWLPSLTPASLNLLYGPEAGSAWLQRLRNEQAFVSDCGFVPPESRYHPLFRAFLLERAKREWAGEALLEWQRRVARALAEVGELEPALELQLAARDYAAAGASVLQHAPELVAQGRARSLAAYLRELPHEAFEAEPRLAQYSAVVNSTAAPLLAGEHAELAMAGFERTGNMAGYWSAWRTLVFARTLAGQSFEQLGPLVEMAFTRLQRGGFDSGQLELLVCRTAAFAASAYLPDDANVMACAERVFTSPTQGDPEELAIALFYFGLHGELPRLDSIVQHWLRARSEEPGIDARLWLALCRSFTAAFSGDFAAASRAAADGAELAERSGALGLTTTLYVYWAYACVGAGDIQSLEQVLQRMERSAEVDSLLELANYRFARGLSALLRQQYVEAREFLTQADADAQRMRVPVAECAHGLGLCEALLQLRLVPEAKAVLARVVSRLPRRSLLLRQSACFIEAALGYEEGSDVAADRALGRALALTRDHGIVPLPVPTRTTLEPLLRRALAAQLNVPAASELVGKFGLAMPTRIASSHAELKPSSESAVPEWFVKSVRSALRHFHQTQLLLKNSLLDALFEPGGTSTEQRVAAVRRALSDAVQRLGNTSRTQPYHRALRHTFLEPAATQLLAADRAGTSFGTYRRHLAAGIHEVAAELWIAHAARCEELAAASPRRRAR